MNKGKLAVAMLVLGVMLYIPKVEAKVFSNNQQQQADETIGKLAQQPNQQEVLLKQGIDALNNKNYQEAIKYFDAVVQIDGNNKSAGVAYYGKGLAYFTLENYDSAINNITEGIKIIPPDARVYFIRGMAYDSKGNKQAALTDYKKAAQLYKEQNDQEHYQQVSQRIQQLLRN